jgi:hypothetical protein
MSCVQAVNIYQSAKGMQETQHLTSQPTSQCKEENGKKNYSRISTFNFFDV